MTYLKNGNLLIISVVNKMDYALTAERYDLTPINFKIMDYLNVRYKDQNYVGKNAEELWNYKDWIAKNRD